ncbi:hypothetical protein [Nocardia tengchongensis]|uniref:hypothetical protein n=1 Tax=Nocardia tengchongensis TaxID=2055889 RepID=UPI003651D3C9
MDRETLLAGLWSARNLQPGLEIEVSEVRELARGGNVLVVRFVAENRLGETRTGRTVTAVLITDGRTYRWRTVHETSTPEP